MIRLAAETSLEQVAWAAFDDAALRLKREYDIADPGHDTDASRHQRYELAVETVRLWDAWRALFLCPDTPGDAA